MFLSTIFLVGAVTALFWWLLKPTHASKMLDKIPGPKRIPILGNALSLSSDTVEFFKQVMNWAEEFSYAKMFRVKVLNQNIVVVHRAQQAEKVLGSMQMLRKAYPYEFIKQWLKTGLLTSTGKKWQSRRKLLTPTFHFKILADFLNVFNEQSEVLTSLLEKKCNGEAFDIFPYVTHCAMDIICETAMGKKVEAQLGGADQAYVDAVYGMSELVMIRFRTPWQWIDPLYRLTERGKRFYNYLDILHSFTRKVIDDRIKELEEEDKALSENSDASEGIGLKKRRAFLDLLIHMAKEANFSIEDIQEEVDTFMFEGHDTTAAGISWAIYLTGCHPDVQKKLHNEMDEIFGDSDRPAMTEDLTKMKYLELVIKESLRILPSVPAIGRMLDNDVEIDGVNVPRGTSIQILIRKINLDPTYFPDPYKFDPDRFLPDNATGRHPYTYVPFSAGPRNCIGQKFAINEEKTVLSAIFRNFSVESTQTIEEIRPIPDLILRPTNGIKVKLTKRVK